MTINIFNLRALAADAGGEYVLGLRDLGTHACYMIYGTVKPTDSPRLIKPGDGHEEIILCVSGELAVTGHITCTLKEGESFHIVGEAECFLTASAPSVYVAAGGHSDEGHHHGHAH